MRAWAGRQQAGRRAAAAAAVQLYYTNMPPVPRISSFPRTASIPAGSDEGSFFALSPHLSLSLMRPAMNSRFLLGKNQPAQPASCPGHSHQHPCRRPGQASRVHYPAFASFGPVVRAGSSKNRSFLGRPQQGLLLCCPDPLRVLLAPAPQTSGVASPQPWPVPRCSPRGKKPLRCRTGQRGSASRGRSQTGSGSCY